MDRSTLQKMLVEHHDPELLKDMGGVLQVWEDGEVTHQKAGDLLHMRGLHQFRAPRFDLRNNPLTLPLSMYDHHCVCLPYEWYKENIEPILADKELLLG